MAEGPRKPWEHAKSGAGSGSDPLAVRFVSSLPWDRRLYRQDIAGSLAHAQMLERVGLLDPADREAIEKGFRTIEAEIEADFDGWWGWREELEDVHMCLEAALTERVGEPALKLHTGRSRNDQIATDLKLWIGDAIATLDRHFENVYRGFVALAERDGRLVIPAYTHWQRAQPAVVGGELVAWLTALDRCQRRIHALWAINRESPLGAGAVAGSALPIDRADTAATLGLDPPGPSSLDATASRDAVLDFVYALTATALTLSRWAEQWIVYCSTEFGMLELDSRYTTGSSMMPQKQNPDMLELIRARSADAHGRLSSLLTLIKGLPIGYQRDLQEDKRHLFPAFDAVNESLSMAGRIAATARFRSPSTEHGFLDATSLADYLVQRGVPFRSAHQLVGRLVQTARERGLAALGELDPATMNAVASSDGFGEPFEKSVADWLGAENVVHRYRTTGNAGISGFEAELAAWRDRLGGDQSAE